MNDLRTTVLEETQKALRSEDGVAGVGTSTGNMPFNKLIAPSTPKSRKDDEQDESSSGDGYIVGMVRRVFEQPDDTGFVGEVECPHCNEVQGFRDDTQDAIACEACHREFVVAESTIQTIIDAGLAEELTIMQAASPANTLSVTPVRQTTNFCGPAALACLLNFLGRNTNENEVAANSGATHDAGVTAEGLIKAAEAAGFDAEFKTGGTSTDIARAIDQDRIPLLYFWWGHGRKGDGPHASLVVGYDDRNVMIMDPEPGLVVPRAWDKFLASWFRFQGPLPAADGLVIGEYVVVKPKD